MEITINREIRSYTESIFFGLSLRQFIFSLLGIGTAVALYFLLRNTLGTEMVSWVCVLGTVPFAALGFITYHGMTAERFAWAWIKSEVLTPKKIIFLPENVYYTAMQEKPSRPKKKTKSKTHKKGKNKRNVFGNA